MPNINQNSLNVLNSEYGTAVFGQNIFESQPGVTSANGIYYTNIFQKASTDMWNIVSWSDNQILTGANNTLGKMKVDVRIRTGSALPWNYLTNKPYTLAQINSFIQNNSIDAIDTIFERAMLGRSIISNINASGVTSSNTNYEQLGTSYNSFRISSYDDIIWNYWSLPILNSPSYIPNNAYYDYLQARIWLLTSDNTTIPEVFNITFSSTLIQ